MMTDELDRIRGLADHAPGPSRDWVDDTRAELLAMAAEEKAAGATDAAIPGWRTRLRRRLADLFDLAPPIAWAGAAAGLVAVVAAVGVLGRAPAPSPPVAGPTETPSVADTGTPSDAVVLAASCTGGGGAYTVDYPRGWHTNPGEVTDGCQHFAEQPVALEEETGGGPATPVEVRLLPVPFDRAAAPGPANREVSREPATVAGRDAVVVDWVSTGDAALPEGLRTHRYLVDLGDQRTLLIAAHDVGPLPYEQAAQVVDEMARSIELDADSSGNRD